jgi:hypothetical protein
MSVAFENGIRWTRTGPKNIPEERVLYEEGKVKITNLLAAFGEDLYSIWGITSARKRKRVHDSWIPLVIIILAAILTGEGWDDGVGSALDDGIKWSLVILGLLLAAYGLYFSESTKPDYVVQLDSPLGEIQAYTTQSLEEAAKIVDAINQAIAQREE